MKKKFKFKSVECFYLNIGVRFNSDRCKSEDVVNLIKKRFKIYTQEFNQKIYKTSIDEEVEFLTLCYRSRNLADLACFAEYLSLNSGDHPKIDELYNEHGIEICNMFIGGEPITGDDLVIAEGL